MNAEQPPLLDPAAGTGRPSPKGVNLSRLGMGLALVAPVVILLMMLLKPG